jgi:hypothetical protein
MLQETAKGCDNINLNGDSISLSKPHANFNRDSGEGKRGWVKKENEFRRPYERYVSIYPYVVSKVFNTS